MSLATFIYEATNNPGLFQELRQKPVDVIQRFGLTLEEVRLLEVAKTEERINDKREGRLDELALKARSWM